MRLGIRLQILLMLGVLLAVAFVPLYFAVAKLTVASVVAARREAARDLGRAVASHVLSAKRDRPNESLGALLDAQLTDGGISAIAIYDAKGAVTAEAGDASLLPALGSHATESSRVIDTATGPMLEVIVPTDRNDGAVVVMIAFTAASPDASPLVRLVALYTGVIAIALLVFAYFAMTRLVVRPIEDVSRAAGRVAGGARSFEIEQPLAREIGELGDSLRAMTEKLLAEEQALRTKLDELGAAKRELESAQESVVRSERLASVGRLAAGVAHEIGNPIAAILGFEELLLADDLPASERNDFLRRMKSETERVNRVLRDLLDFARPGAPARDETTTHADVREAATLVATLLKPQKRLANLTLDVDVEPDTPDVAMSAERLQQVLLNLILNAADAATSRILVGARTDGETVSISVADDGPGVAEQIRDRLFEPFATTKDVGEGTGLGLAVCRGLVEAAGGTIRLGDTDLGGACFVLSLPKASFHRR